MANSVMAIQHTRVRESIAEAIGRWLLAVMPGASKMTRQVMTINANWTAADDGGDGRFEVLILTDDDERHVIAPSPEAMTALVALTLADTVLLWDPADRTLIVANIVGKMPWTEGIAARAAQRE
jgi:hypothetical protein